MLMGPVSVTVIRGVVGESTLAVFNAYVNLRRLWGGFLVPIIRLADGESA